MGIEIITPSNIISIAQVIMAFFLLIFTKKLSDSTKEYSEQVGKQTKIMNKNIENGINVTNYNRLRDEMDKLVAPLYSLAKTGFFEYYEPLHRKTDKEAIDFWIDIKKCIYLAPKDLRESIEKYLIAYERQDEELRKTRYEIKEVSDGNEETKKVFLPAPVKEGYGSYIQDISNLRTIHKESDLGKRLDYFLDIAQDGHKYDARYNNEAIKISVEETRSELIKAVGKRHLELDKEIEKLREEFGKTIVYLKGIINIKTNAHGNLTVKRKHWWKFWK